MPGAPRQRKARALSERGAFRAESLSLFRARFVPAFAGDFNFIGPSILTPLAAELLVSSHGTGTRYMGTFLLRVSHGESPSVDFCGGTTFSAAMLKLLARVLQTGTLLHHAPVDYEGRGCDVTGGITGEECDHS